jgi:hypothetical protein
MDIKISKPFVTPSGDELRAIYTIGNSVILAAVGKGDSRIEAVIVQLPPTAPQPIAMAINWGKLWDIIKPWVKKGLDLIDGGGGTGGGGGAGGGGGCGNINVGPITVEGTGGNQYGGNVSIIINCN